MGLCWNAGSRRDCRHDKNDSLGIEIIEIKTNSSEAMTAETSIIAQSVAAALFLALANIIAAVLSFRKAQRSADIQECLSTIIASMIARVVCMLGVSWYGLKVAKLHQLAFTLTLLSAYILSMAAEIWYIHLQQLRYEARKKAASGVS